MKKSIVFLIFFILISICSFSQTPQYYNGNTGAYNNAFPFMMMPGKAVNWLFGAGELNKPVPLPVGNSIVRIYFHLQTGGSNTYTSLQILMAQSTITSLPWTTFYPGPWDTVYNHTNVTITGVDGGWMWIDLDHSYNYDPTKSLIVFVGQCGTVNCCNLIIWQSIGSSVRRCWSVGGCPYDVYGGDAMVVDFGVDVTNTPLPIVLLSFSGKCVDNVVTINWSTASEINNDYFIIEKSNDARIWNYVKKINGAGNSNQRIDYSITDEYTGDNYYRLSQTDYDGKYKRLFTVFVSCISTIPSISIYPNPVSDLLYIKTNELEISGIKIFEDNGKVLYDGKEKIVDISSYAPCMYFVKITTTDGQIFYQKIIKK